MTGSHSRLGISDRCPREMGTPVPISLVIWGRGESISLGIWGPGVPRTLVIWGSVGDLGTQGFLFYTQFEKTCKNKLYVQEQEYVYAIVHTSKEQQYYQ